MASKRLHYLDNLRWSTVILVFVYHLFYIFNCAGVTSNINVQGYPALDVPCMFLYPWFMVFMFVIAGMSARYSLQRRSGKEFLKDRAVRILVPSLAGVVVYGWIVGWVGMQFAEDSLAEVPRGIVIMIMFLSGEGPLWFCRVLFLACAVLLLLRKIDKNEKLLALGEKAGLPVLIALAVPVWLSSLVLNMPMITVYRFGIYTFAFLLGYYVLSHETVQKRLEQAAVWLAIPAVILGVVICMIWLGKNYTEDAFLKHPLVNVYLWMMVLALLGLGRRFLEFRNKFTDFMTSRSQSYYLLHYVFISLTGYFCVTKLTALPFWSYYIIMAAVSIGLMVPIVELLMRIPVVNRLVLGVIAKKK